MVPAYDGAEDLTAAVIVPGKDGADYLTAAVMVPVLDSAEDLTTVIESAKFLFLGSSKDEAITFVVVLFLFC